MDFQPFFRFESIFFFCWTLISWNKWNPCRHYQKAFAHNWISTHFQDFINQSKHYNWFIILYPELNISLHQCALLIRFVDGKFVSEVKFFMLLISLNELMKPSIDLIFEMAKTVNVWTSFKQLNTFFFWLMNEFWIVFA